MSLRNLKNNESQAFSSVNFKKTELSPVRVFSVILDNTHPKYTGEDSIGTIFYGKVDLNESSVNIDNLNRAKPVFSFIKYFPLINEIVLVFNSTSNNIYKDTKGDNIFTSTYYFPNLNVWNNSQQNALPLERELKNKENPQEASLGIQQNNVEKNNIKLGEYFTEKDNLKSIQPFEGDMILEGRFGNSIRFGSSNPRGKNNWSENGSIGDPVTIISNGQPEVSGDTVLEDINNIDSSIFMLSNQNINNFIPASNNIQSIGATFTPPPTKQVIIEDTPPPPVTPSPEPIIEETPEPIIEEKPQIISPPTEEEITTSVEIDDPIFALLDEAQDEGNLTFIESNFEIAGTESDSDDEIATDFYEGNPPSWIEENEIATNTLRNSAGNTITIPPPDPNLVMRKTSTRNIKYIFLHTAGSSTTATPLSLMKFFFRPDDPLKEGFQGRGFDVGGYHWIIEQNGDATRLYSDSIATSGVKGFNGNSIHLNWIGGATSFNMTQNQAYTMSRLLKKYLDIYPNAKVIGHNQVTGKVCPLFHTPTFAQNIGINSNQIDNRNIIGMKFETAVQNANQISNGL